MTDWPLTIEEAPPALHGIPIGVKDILAAHEGPTTARRPALDDATAVGALPDAAGLNPPEEDVEALVQGYARNRQMAAPLFTVKEARYESPALNFPCDPRHAEWP
jgi:hypothetical protein